MSNAPFKIAFWVMCLAFGLTVLLTGLKPEEIRSTLNPTASRSKSVPDSLTDQPNSDILTEFRENQETFSSTESATAVPVRVAMNTADRDFELDPYIPRSESQFELNLSRSSADPVPPEVHIPVPQPEQYSREETSFPDEILQMQRELSRIRLAEARRELDEAIRDREEEEFKRVQAQLEEIRTHIIELKKRPLFQYVPPEVESVSPVISGVSTASNEIARNAQLTIFNDNSDAEKSIEPAMSNSVNPASAAADLSTNTEVEEAAAKSVPEFVSVANLTADSEAVFEIAAIDETDQLRCRFERADLRSVLEELGKKAGWKVVLEKAIEGQYSGQFGNVPADQAFVSVIKANNFGVSFRGNYVLVRAQKDAKVR